MFERCLFSFQAGCDPAPAVAIARRFVARPRILHVLLHIHGIAPFWSHEPEPPDDALDPILEGWAETVDGEVVEEFDVEAVRRVAERHRSDLVIVGPFRRGLPRSLAWIEDLARATGRPALFAGGEPGGPVEPGGSRRIVCPFDSDVRAIAPLAGFLRDRLEARDEVVLLALGEPDPPIGPTEELAELAGVSARVSVERLEAGLTELASRFEARIAAGVDLVAMATGSVEGVPGVVLSLFGRDLLARFAAPVLVVPAARDPSAGGLPPGRLDAADALQTPDGALRIAVDRLDLLGRPADPAPIPLVLVVRGRRAGSVVARRGVVECRLPPGEPPAAIGLGREEPSAGGEPLESVEVRISVVDPGSRPVWLLDPAIGEDAARGIAAAAGDALRLAVRLRPEESVRDVREALARAGLSGAPVLDAGAILDDGRPDDLPGGIEDVRLVRVACRLRAEGVRVEAVVSARSRRLPAGGVAFLLASDLGDPVAAAARVRSESRALSPGGALDELTVSRLVPGNRVEIDLDNGRARRRLVELVDGASERVHLETFIVREDEATREIEAALVRAAGRGVRIRFLVDSLWSFHHAFGRTNPLLDRLAALAGATILPFRPIEGLPNVEDLKLRDHRKLALVDGRIAVVSGRNLASSYYTGFDEVALDARTPHFAVPWLDAGIEVEGPLVESIERAFQASWIASGGDRYEIVARPPAGPVAARLVLHEGLRDAWTTDAYLAMFRAARDRIVIVNTFPIQKEIAHALGEAIERGVRVRILVGHVRPVFGDASTPFPGGVLRELATQIVHGRLDGLVEAGAEIYELGLVGIAGWDEPLGRVRPHIHAKIVSVDGRSCTVGSANLDITAGYWDSEAMVLVEDPRVAADLEARIEALLATSVRIERDDPHWRALSSRRAWLSRNWPSIIG